MPSFYARINFSCSFAQSMIEKHVSPFSVFMDNLPRGTVAECVSERYTFGIIKIDSPTADECCRTVDDIWARSFPENIPDHSVLITPADGTDPSELMCVIYKVYYGFEPYQALVTELTAAIPLMKERGALSALRNRNYLFAIDNGCGFTRLLSSFGDYLHRMGVYESTESKRTKYAEYRIGKETGNGCVSVDDVIGDLKVDPNETETSVIGIDITYFLEGNKFDELRAVARRLYSLQDQYIFAFRIPFLEKKAMDEIADVISDVMFVKTVQIPPLHDAALFDFACDELRRMGYSCNSTLYETFCTKLRAEKLDGRFYGFKTAEKVVYEMIFQKTARDHEAESNGRTVDREFIDVSDIYLSGNRQKAVRSGYDELAELIGMEKISAKVREIAAQVKLSIVNEKLDRPCIHMRFVGAPGTGKTTVARIIGQIFREEGILRKGAFLEYSARALCAEYVGQTAVRTASICRDAYGSVLFLDEAYALYDGTRQSNDYGKEALTTLISEMENHRDDMLVIMAGYTDDMQTLMDGNAGLRSRMPFMIEFPNYTRRQLYEIFMLMVRKHFEYEPGLDAEAERFFNSLSQEYMDSREFANARFVRNLYERTWSKCATRVTLDGQAELKLTKQDFIAASGEKEFCEKLQTEKHIGF